MSGNNMGSVESMEGMHEVYISLLEASLISPFLGDLACAFIDVLPEGLYGEEPKIVMSSLRKIYVDVLCKHNKLYHFDDSAENIIIGGTDDEPAFSSEEARIVNLITEVLYSEELFSLALDKLNQGE